MGKNPEQYAKKKKKPKKTNPKYSKKVASEVHSLFLKQSLKSGTNENKSS